MLKRFLTLFEDAKKEDKSFGLIINFSKNRLDNLGKKRGLNQIMKLAQKLEIPIVPIRLSTSIHPFLAASMNAKLIKRTRKEPIKINVRIGSPISIKDQIKFEKISRFRKFIQSKIFSLGTSLEIKPFFKFPISNFHFHLFNYLIIYFKMNMGDTPLLSENLIFSFSWTDCEFPGIKVGS